MKIRALGLGLGTVFVAAGVGFIFWPAALIVAGLPVLAWALLSDDGQQK